MSTRRRRSVLAIALLLVVASAAGLAMTTVTGEPSAETILDRTARAYDTAESYSAEATVTLENDTDVRRVEVRLLYAEPRKHRVDVQSPANLSGAAAGTNGTVAWATPPDNDTVFVRALDERHRDLLQPEAAIERLRRNATVEVVGEEAVAGVDTSVIEVRPADDPDALTATLWIETGDAWLRKATVEKPDGDGDGTVTVVYTAFRANVSIHDSTFEPPGESAVTLVEPAEGTTYGTLAAAQAETSLRIPDADLSPGYAVANVTLLDRDGETVAVVRYDNETATVAVLATTADELPAVERGTAATVAGSNATVVESRGGRVVYWPGVDGYLAVAGDRPVPDLLRLAEAVAEAAD